MTAYGVPGPAPELAEALATIETLRRTIEIQSNALAAMRVRCATYSAELTALTSEAAAAWETGQTARGLRQELAAALEKISRLEHEVKLLRAERDGARVDLGSVAS